MVSSCLWRSLSAIVWCTTSRTRTWRETGYCARCRRILRPQLRKWTVSSVGVMIHRSMKRLLPQMWVTARTLFSHFLYRVFSWIVCCHFNCRHTHKGMRAKFQASCNSSKSGTNFTKRFWAHIPNLVETPSCSDFCSNLPIPRHLSCRGICRIMTQSYYYLSREGKKTNFNTTRIMST